MPAASVAVKKPPQIPPSTKNIKPIIEKPEYISVFVNFVVKPTVSGSGASFGF